MRNILKMAEIKTVGAVYIYIYIYIDSVTKSGKCLLDRVSI